MAESQATLDRGYCKPVQSIDTNITEDGGPARYYAEVPKKAESTDAWLQSLAASGDGESAQNGPQGNPASTDAVLY
jgi:hypothetical protein